MPDEMDDTSNEIPTEPVESLESPDAKDDFNTKANALVESATPEQLDYLQSCIDKCRQEDGEVTEFSDEDMPK